MREANQPGAGGRTSFACGGNAFGDTASIGRSEVSLTEIRIWRSEPICAGIDARASLGDALFCTTGIASRTSASASSMAALISMRVDFCACRIVTAPPTHQANTESPSMTKKSCVRIE
jgi:hypothetical protein